MEGARLSSRWWWRLLFVYCQWSVDPISDGQEFLLRCLWTEGKGMNNPNLFRVPGPYCFFAREEGERLTAHPPQVNGAINRTQPLLGLELGFIQETSHRGNSQANYCTASA